MWPPGVPMGWSQGGRAAALELLTVLCTQHSYVRGQAPPAQPSSSGLLPAVLAQFPGPGWAAPVQLSHITAGIVNWAGHSGLALQRLETFLCPTVSTAVAASPTSGMKQQHHFLLLSSCVVWELDSVRQFSLGMSRGCRRSWWRHGQGVLTTCTHLLAGVGCRLGSQQTP